MSDYSEQRRMRWREGLIRSRDLWAGMAILSLGIGAMLINDAITYRAKVLEAESWVKTPCTVIRSGIKERLFPTRRFRYRTSKHRSHPMPWWTLDVAFTYEYDQKWYSFFQHYPFAGDYACSMDFQALRNIAMKTPVGYRTTCFVNPENPSEATLTLEPSLELRTLLWESPLVVTAGIVCSVLAYQGYRLAPRKNRY